MRAAYGVDSMPETGENVADQFGIARDDQDGFALRSQQRAGAAAARHRGEITPVAIPGHKGADALVVTTDEHPRPATTAEQLARLKPVVRPSGTVTAGNASGINDGAAALLVASEAGIARHGLTPIARIMGAASAGVEPRIMGIGPVPATQRLMARLGLTVDQFAVIELNEAFASQALATLRELGIPDDAPHVNPHGGAIALGHPLGMSGASWFSPRRARSPRRTAITPCAQCASVSDRASLWRLDVCECSHLQSVKNVHQPTGLMGIIVIVVRATFFVLGIEAVIGVGGVVSLPIERIPVITTLALAATAPEASRVFRRQFELGHATISRVSLAA
ncbi:thiolase family protein [Rhizorhabdus wittichii]